MAVRNDTAVMEALSAAKQFAAEYSLTSRQQLEDYYNSVKDLKDDITAEREDINQDFEDTTT